MEDLLNGLLMPSSDAIKAASAQLKTVLKADSVKAVGELCRVMASSQTPQIRQYAAVLLRKRFYKAKNWTKALTDADRAQIKAGCLEALVAEQEKGVRAALAQLISVIAKHELAAGAGTPTGGWPELMAFLDQAMKGGNKQLGFLCLSALTDESPDQMMPNIEYLATALMAALQDESDRTLGFYAVRSLSHLAPYVGSDHIKFVQPLVPAVIALVKALLAANDDRACECMDLFDDLMECEVAIVVPYLKPILELMMSVAAEKQLDDGARLKAIVFLGAVVKMKKKTVIKNNMVEGLIGILFPIMCEPYDEDDEDEEETDVESGSPAVCACQTLDQLAINLPPGKFLPHLLTYVTQAMVSQDPNHVRAAYHAVAVCIEGCSEYIKTHHFDQFVKAILDGIQSANTLVRNAALYALGQASEFLQPGISSKPLVDQFLPVLVRHLDTAIAQLQSQQDKEKKVAGLDRIFYALEVFSENLGKDLIPYLEEILKRLLQLITPQFSNHVQELAISLVGSSATAVEESIAPFAKDIIAVIKPYLTLECTEENQILMMQSLDTLASLARAVGSSDFEPTLAGDCAALGMNLIDKYDDPDVRKCCYSLMAAVASIMKEGMGDILNKLVPVVILSVTSNEGISFEFKEDEDSGLPVEELSDDDGEDDAGDDDEVISLGSKDDEDAEADAADEQLDKVKTISVENSFMEEKQQAICALREFSADTGPAFHPFLQPAFEAVWKAIDFPDEDVRRASVDAVTQFAVAYFRAGQSSEYGQIVNVLVPKLCTMVKEDDEVGVASICLESLTELLKETKAGVTTANPAFPQDIVATVAAVLKSECACMDTDGDADDAEDDDIEESEQDEALFDVAGDVLPTLGMAMTPETFLPVYRSLFPLLMKKTKKQCSPAERGFAVGSFAECMQPLRGVIDPATANELMQLFVRFMNDENKDVRNNAIFGLGELALNAGPATMVQHYPAILTTLSNHLSKGDEARCVDQIVGAVSRLIVGDKSSVPLGEVLPVVFNHLPLKEDTQEYPMVFRCLFEAAYQECKASGLLTANLTKLFEMSVSVVNDKDAEAEAKAMAKAAVQALCKDFEPEMKAMFAGLQPETVAKFEVV